MTRLDALLTAASGHTNVAIPTAPTAPAVEGIGPLDAKIAIITDRYFNEDYHSKKKVHSWLKSAGISPERCRFETTTEGVRELENVQVIACIGSRALSLFTGHTDITKHRGSVYRWEGKKVIGIIPPDLVRKHKAFEVHSRMDCERIKVLVTPHTTHHLFCGCAVPLKRTHITPYDNAVIRYTHNGVDILYPNIERYIQQAQDTAQILAIDIETPVIDGSRQILCVGFAFSSTESLVLPWAGHEESIRRLCESPCAKIGHNFVSFDRWWLARSGINTQGRIYDSLCEAHALNPAGRHSLEFLTSVHTWEPYYKDESKGHDIRVIAQNYGSYFDYCGLDACLSRELHDIFWSRLSERKMISFYEQHYEALYDPIFDLMMRGVRIDHTYRENLLRTLLTEAQGARDTLGEINGLPLFTLTTKRDKAVYAALIAGSGELPYPPDLVKKSLETISKKTVSGAQLKTLLYNKMGLPAQYARRSNGDETLTADSVTLRHLKLDHPDRPEVAQVVDLAQAHNKAQKLASFCYPKTFDTDGRFRFTLRLNTEASRLASSQAPDGLGRNSQNTPRDKRIRRLILPEPGHVLVEADLSQAEGRFCFVYTKDAELVRLARLRSSHFDQHKYVVSILPKKSGTCFGFPLEEIPSKSDERQVAKSINHAAQRNIKAKTAVDTLLKQDERFLYTEEDVEKMLAAYFKVFSPVLTWQASIRKEVRTKGCLVSSWGHSWDVHYDEMNDDLFRRAYSWKMQRDCAGLTNQQGFIPLYRWLKKEKMASRIMLQEHDSLVCSCAPDEAYDVAAFLATSLEAPREYDGIELSVPVELKIGRSWGDTSEFDELPDRETFEKVMLTYAA